MLGLNNLHRFLKIIYPIYYHEIIDQYAIEYHLDPYLVAAIIKTESKFSEKAESNKQARGLMQIVPVTGKWAAQELKITDYNETMLFIPDINIRIGCWYLDKLRTEFGGNLSLMITAYNGGSGNVHKWLKNRNYSEDGRTLQKIPFDETRMYVKRVLKNYKIYKTIYRR